MALVLLVASGLLLRSMARLAAVDPGFRVDGLLTAGVSLGQPAGSRADQRLLRRVLDEIAGLPGVTSVGASNSLPIEGAGMNGSSFEIESRPRPEDAIRARDDVPGGQRRILRDDRERLCARAARHA